MKINDLNDVWKALAEADYHRWLPQGQSCKRVENFRKHSPGPKNF